MNPFIESFVNNREMFESVRDEVLRAFTLQDIEVDGFLNSNEQLGEVVRAKVGGSKLVMDAFRKMERYKTPPKESEEVNPGR